MPLIHTRAEALALLEEMRRHRVSMALFCTASHWNTEAILMAGQRFARAHHIERLPLAVAITVNYPHMSQARRVTHSGDDRLGFAAIMGYLRLLCAKDGPYPNVYVLPHLDHGQPDRDLWALTESLDCLASVMFDAQSLPYEENVRRTREYVRAYGGHVLVEGVMDTLNVQGSGATALADDDYVRRALRYVEQTGVDCLVADLGTEQQSESAGHCRYLGQRARDITAGLGRAMLCLHGTSCLTREQVAALPDDGILRVNMWTRIARQAGLYAAHNLQERLSRQPAGFEDIESRQYLYDSMEEAGRIMEETLGLLQYARLDPARRAEVSSF